MDILEKVRTQGLLLDGAMGSILISRGFDGSEAAELWNLRHPDIIRQIHQDYFDAGADVASANTHGACSIKLKKMGLDDHVEKLNRTAVRLAREASGPNHYVAADVGALGEMLQPSGPIAVEEAVDSFTEQAGILDDEGIDLFLIETVFDLNVGLAAIKAIRSVSKKPIFCSLTFKKMKKGFFTLYGNTPEQSMKSLADAGASAVGANCSMGSRTMVELAREIRRHAPVPVIIQPNAGMPEAGPDGSAVYPENTHEYSENIRQIKQLGVEIVGGCCGTTPDYIRAIRNILAEEGR